MQFEEFINQTEKKLNIKIKNFQKEQLIIYFSFLVENNKKINLYSFDDQELWLKYFYHSIFVYWKTNFNDCKTCLDLGSGSGTPGIILKILYPHLCLTIVEANHKKTNFISCLVKKLKLTNVKILTSRIEEIKPNHDNQFDLVTARAVAPLEQLLELTIPYAKHHGLVILPKSKNYLKEVTNLSKEINILGGQLIFNDMQLDHAQTFITLYIKKVKKTPSIYPRKYSQIVKGFNYGNNSK